MAKAEATEPYGWWACFVKSVREDLVLIEYEGWENHHEVLQHSMLRPYNNQFSANLRVHVLFMYEIIT